MCRHDTHSSPMHSRSTGSSFVASSSPCTAPMIAFMSYMSDGHEVMVRSSA